MPPAGSELAFPASELPQVHALDRAAAGIGITTASNGKLSSQLHAVNSLIHKETLEFLDFVFILTCQVMGRHAWFAVE
jgi:hypothetical protein